MSLTLNVEGGSVVVVDHDDDGNPTLSVSGSRVTLTVKDANLLANYLTSTELVVGVNEETDAEPAE
jgi:hypothetical protein